MQAAKSTLIATASVGALLAVLGASPAAATPITFTWNPGATSPVISTGSPSFTTQTLGVTDYAEINTSNPGDVLESGILAVTSLNASAGGGGFYGGLSGNDQFASGGATPYQLYIQYSTTSVLGAGGTGVFTSISYSLYGVADNSGPGGACSYSVSSAGAVANCSGANTPVKLASGSLSPYGLNSVSIEGSSPNIDVSANADTSIVAAAGESGFFVSPTNITLFDFQNAFSNTTGEVSTYSASPTNSGYLVTQGSGSLTMVQVPEPQTLAMFGFGLIGLGWLVRRRAKTS